MISIEQTISKIESRNFTVGVVGMGYVGLPVALTFLEAGFNIIGFDVDRRKVDQLNAGQSYIRHIEESRITRAHGSDKFLATTDFSQVANCDAILICVPTPLTKQREPDLQYVVATCESIWPHLRAGHIVILESTTYPGTTEDVVLPILQKSGLKADEDFLVAYAPEREDPNNPHFTTSTTPRVIGSTSPAGLTVAACLYQQIVEKTICVSSTKTAEATKLLENIFRSVNIALVNEMKTIFMKMDIDIWEVIEAASTKPFGFMPFYPGPGLGGHCIPIDPFYLTWKAKEYGVNTRFIELAGEINRGMPDFVVERVTAALNAKGKPVNGSKILFLGLAYKPNVDDLRESPSLYLMNTLEEKGAIVEYNDPHIPVIPETREFPHLAGKRSVGIDSECDLMLIATAHKEYLDFDFAKIDVPVVDTRNVVRGQIKNLVKA